MMKWKNLVLASILLLGAGTSGVTWAHGHHHGSRVGVGVYLAAPLGWYYPPAYYYRPAPVVVVPAAPTVYVEQGPNGPVQSQSDGYWYYCRNPDGYYPYVKDCSGEWQRVAPQPPSRMQ